MPVLTDAELRMVAEVVSELAKLRGTSFDKAATGFTFARAALIDPAGGSPQAARSAPLDDAADELAGAGCAAIA